MFVKHGTGAVSRRELAREAGLLRLLGRAPRVAALASLPVGFDGEDLVLELVPGRDLGTVEGAGAPVGATVGAAVGTAVAEVHAAAAPLLLAAPEAVSSEVFGMPRPDPAFLRRRSGAEIDLLRLLQRSGALSAHIDRLGRRRGRDTLVHGDLRLENVMVETSRAGDPAVRLVDWEFAGRGEALEDLGAFVGACLDVWISSVPSVPGVPAERLVRRAGRPLEALTPAIEAFLGAYCDAREIDGEAAFQMRCGALEFAAARLVHLAFEAASGAEGLRIDHVLRLQVAENILDDPAAALEWVHAPRQHANVA